MHMPPSPGRWVSSAGHPSCTVLEVSEPEDDGFFLVTVAEDGSALDGCEFDPAEWANFVTMNALTPA